jgi:hypothetical protein
MRTTVVALVLAAGAAVACGKGGGSSKWDDHKGDIPFLIGQAAGARAVAATHRPPMYFFTATW